MAAFLPKEELWEDADANRKWAGEVSSVLALMPFLVSLVVSATLFVPPEEDKKLSPNLLSNRISDGASLEDSRLLSVVPTSDSAEWLNNNLMFKTFLPDKSPNRNPQSVLFKVGKGKDILLS